MTTLCPAAQCIAETLNLDEVEAAFAEVVIWYDGFKNKERMPLLPIEPNDIKAIVDKRNRARQEKDFKTADFLRDVLIGAGLNRYCRDKPVTNDPSSPMAGKRRSDHEGDGK